MVTRCNILAWRNPTNRGAWQATVHGDTKVLDMTEQLKLSLSGFLGGSDSKESACSTGDLSSITGSGRLPGEGNGYALQYSCLENPMDREA